LLAVLQQAYVCGVSTRRVDQLVESLGLRISRSEVSRVCAALDEHVDAFRTRPLEGAYPYVFLDAEVRHEALSDRAGCETPPPARRSGLAKLRAA
jgi:transposase-like protein